MLAVAVAGADVHHRGDSAAELCPASIYLRRTDDVAVENREQTDGVEGIVDEHSIQQKHILYRGAASDVQLTALVAGGNHTGQHLQVLRKVGCAANRRHLLDVFGRYRDDRRACLCDHPLRFSIHIDALQHDVVGRHCEIAVHHHVGDLDGVAYGLET